MKWKYENDRERIDQKNIKLENSQKILKIVVLFKDVTDW